MDVARRAVPAWLAPFAVGEMTGFVARSPRPVRAIEAPFGGLPLIVSFGPRIHRHFVVFRPTR